MKKIFTNLSVVAVLLTSISISAQEEEKSNEFSASLQLRPRFEYRNGAYRPLEEGEKPAILTTNRVRFTMDYANSDLLKVKLSLQNVNIWGQAAQVQVNDPSGGFSVYEAYADVKLAEGLRTKVGRQAISLDDERIFGALDWHQAGRSHDAIELQYKKNKSELSSYFAYNQNYKIMSTSNINNPAGQYFSPTDAQPYQHMELLYYKYNLNEKSYLSFLFNNLGFENTTVSSKVYNMQTLGGNYFATFNDKLKGNLTAYYQFGKNNSGVKKSAYLLSGSVGYKVSNPIALTLGVDYLSGNDTNSTSSTSHVFDPLYGTHHKFYGFMDNFYVGNGHSNVGLLDTYLKFSGTLSPKFSIGVDAHFFNSGAKVYDDSNDKMSSFLGNEWDLTFNYKVMPYVTLVGGYSNFFDTKTLRQVKNTPDARSNQDWLWVSLNVNPQILKAKF